MADDKNEQDGKRAKTADDILGITHGGGRDQYGGSFGGGQSGGGSYANPHTGQGGGQAGSQYGGHGGTDTTGGQSSEGYYGGGQLGDRNLGDHSHSAGSTAGGTERGDTTYQDHASQKGEDVGDGLANSLRGSGFDEHQGFGEEHQGQHEQGRQTDRSG